jgi:hypothetical protein
MALSGWFKATLLALGAMFLFSGCFVVTTDHRGGHRSSHRRGYSGGHSGYSSSHNSNSGYRSGSSRGKSGYKSGSKSCPPGHVWSDGRCHDKGKGHSKH